MSMEIGTYGSILQDFRVPSVPAAGMGRVREQDGNGLNDLKDRPAQEADTYEGPTLTETRKPDAPLEDISVTFNKGDDFGYIGRDSDIHSLDVERAISDMQKDKLLQQYQYFVGDVQNLYAQHQPADGIVVPGVD